jgi:hypothetical protein
LFVARLEWGAHIDAQNQPLRFKANFRSSPFNEQGLQLL